ncbi:MAG TPA: hypothetical protein H9796_13140 [Candidatus Butyricimonas faecavium]|nr:hypothetical protein [Candidatus Butyricimonas faecavium]
MNRILLLFMLLVVFISCHDDDVFYENPTALSDIKLLSVRADHKMLLPDGKAKMRFYITAFGIKELPDYSAQYKGEDNDTVLYVPRVACDTFRIPDDVIPAGVLKLYDEHGNEVPDAIYSTTDVTERMLYFYAKSGELESERIAVQIRKLPEQTYKELEFPVIFHVLNPAEQVGVPSFKITEEVVKKNLERLNDVFGRVVTTDPNGADARIKFVAAKYDVSGMKLAEEGIHNWEISASESFEDIDDYEEYVRRNELNLIYDYRHYLNIWLINYPQGANASVKSPTVILSGEYIPGLNAQWWPLDQFPEKPRDVGFFINMSAFLNPMSSTDFFEISNPMAQFFGLLSTQASENYEGSNLVNGDTDYCPDTYYYWNDNSSVLKNTSKEEDSMDENTEYFTSYNVMDRYSWKNSITVDQVARIREHIEKCPSRWMYKSKYALTGLREDWEAIN